MVYKTIEDYELRYGAYGMREQAKAKKREDWIKLREEEAGEREYLKEKQEEYKWEEYHRSRAVRPDLTRRNR